MTTATPTTIAPGGPAWRNSEHDRFRGVKLIRIRDGKTVEARGYVKAGDYAPKRDRVLPGCLPGAIPDGL